MIDVSERSEINEKGGQMDRKSRSELMQNAKNLNNTFWWKIRPTLGSNISGTKCDRDKPIFFSAGRGIKSDRDEA